MRSPIYARSGNHVRVTGPVALLLFGVALLAAAFGLYLLLPKLNKWIGTEIFRSRTAGPVVVGGVGVYCTVAAIIRLVGR
jgi:hypothetical protein